MAEVFRAVMRGPRGFEKTVAVKRILPALGRFPHFRDRFIQEARLAADLTHSNIVQVLEFGELDGTCYIALEYVDGVDVDRLAPAVAAKPPPPPPPAAPVAPRRRMLDGKAVVFDADPTRDPMVARARAACKTGDAALAAGELATAERAYQGALDSYAGYVAAYRGLARVASRRGNDDLALDLLQTYIGRAPTAPDAAQIRLWIRTLSESQEHVPLP